METSIGIRATAITSPAAANARGGEAALAARLITIGASHFCEKVRWAFDLANLPYREEAHAPLTHLWSVWRAGGTRKVPVLVAPCGRLVQDSTTILRWIQAHPAATWRPYPAEPEPRREVEALEDWLDEKLGPHIARLCTASLLSDRDLALQIVEGRGSTMETRLVGRIYGPLSTIVNRMYRITPESIERSRQRIDTIFAEVGAKLADGRAFLAGDSMTAADITFAALAGMMVLPPQYGWPMPALSRMPADHRARVEAWRATRAGGFVLDLYVAHRTASPETTGLLAA